MSISGPAESQYQLEAARRGLFRVDLATLRQINELDGLSVFTTFDYLPVDNGDGVGAAKVTPILIPERLIERAEQICGERPPLQVKPFRPCRVAGLVLDRVDVATRERFARDMASKLEWFGSSLLSVRAVQDNEAAFSGAFGEARQAGAQVIMAAGASSLDPLEPLFLALERVGARIEKHGVPAHPGSLFWMAYLEDVPVFGLSSCEMFSHKTILDLVLPRSRGCTSRGGNGIRVESPRPPASSSPLRGRGRTGRQAGTAAASTVRSRAASGTARGSVEGWRRNEALHARARRDGGPRRSVLAPRVRRSR